MYNNILLYIKMIHIIELKKHSELINAVARFNSNRRGHTTENALICNKGYISVRIHTGSLIYNFK